MFDFDAGKLILIGIVALIVIGPKDLPRVLRELGRAVGKMRRMAAEFQGQFMEAVREADMADIKDDVAKLAASAKVDIPFNPVADMRNELKGAIDGTAPLGQPSAGSTDLMVSSSASKALPSLSDGSIKDPGAAEAPPTFSRREGDAEGSPDRGEATEDVDAEMRALARALEAEIRAASHPEVAEAPAAAHRESDSTLQNNA
jgi:sec-independent protein translocase protein TatB